MDLVKTILLVIIGLISFAYGDVSHVVPPPAQQGTEALPVTDICLGCICEAASECDRTLKCSGDICGLFRITWAYWSDAGKPTQVGEAPDSPNAYANCVNEPFCAARTIQGYMKRFGQDCNGDGKVDCHDYVRIHKFGGYGCRGELELKYKQRYEQCISAFSQ